MLNRRTFVQAGYSVPALVAAPALWAQAKPEKIVVLSHRVHMSVLTGAKGGDDFFRLGLSPQGRRGHQSRHRIAGLHESAAIQHGLLLLGT